MVRTTKAILVAVACAVLTAPAALAATAPVLTGYGGQGGETQGTLGGVQGEAATLPFTGIELSLVAMLGAALLVAGFVLRRSSAAHR